MGKNKFDIVMYTNAAGLGTECISSAHRLPFIKGIAKSMEGIGNVLVLLRYRSIPQCWFNKNEKTALPDDPVQLDENLWSIRPTIVGNLIMASHFSPMKWIIRKQISNQIGQAMRSLNMIGQRIAWMTHPYHYLYFGCAGESSIVYECYDEFVFDNSGKRNKRTELLELEMARNTKLNIATAKPLYDKLFAVNSKTMLVSNGAINEVFKQCRDTKYPIAPEMDELPSPVIGMMGTLYKGYDFELLDDIINKKKEWSFVFVGEVCENAKDDVDRLSKYSNFHLFGWRSYFELPSFLKGFDVAIIPYLVNDWTNTINPNKIYDYYAAGIPVIATPIVELCHQEKYVTLCQNCDEFTIAIEQALKGSLENKIQKGIQFAELLSWDLIAKEIICELVRLINKT